MIITKDKKPPLGIMGGSVHDWERSLDPFHRDAFPNEWKNPGTNGERKEGWMAIDGAGNQIGFLPDGYEMKFTYPCVQCGGACTSPMFEKEVPINPVCTDCSQKPEGIPYFISK